MLMRNDDICAGIDVDRLYAIQAIFESHKLRETYSVIPYGTFPYDDQYHGRMSKCDLERLVGDTPIGSDNRVMDFLRNSINRGHSISLHGWKHVNVNSYEDKLSHIGEARDYLECILKTKISYFVAPFNAYDGNGNELDGIGLKLLRGGGQLEKMVETNTFESHNVYWYHWWRFKDLRRLDKWLTRFLRIE